MKYIVPVLFLLPLLLSCNAKPKSQADADSTKIKDAPISYTGPFDLAKLELKENIPAVVKEQQIKLEAFTDADKTILGYERVKSHDAQALKYGAAILAGTDGKNKNFVLFHYNEKTNKLAFFQVMLFTRAQATALHDELSKLGATTFKKKWPDGSVELDENGNAVAPKPDEKQTFEVWDDKRTGISYLFSVKESTKTFTAELNVLKQAEQSGKDWLGASALDWYKNTKSD